MVSFEVMADEQNTEQNREQHAYANFKLQCFLNISTINEDFNNTFTSKHFFTETNRTRSNMPKLIPKLRFSKYLHYE